MDPLRDVSPELRDVAARLRDERPQLTSLELDALQRRTLSRMRAHGTRAGFLRSRLSVAAVLSFGLVFSTAGAGLAISGATESGSASSAQYANHVPHPTVGPITTTTPSTHRPSPSGPAVGSTSTPATPATSAQPIRQTVATSSGSSLPFTGLAAIPILVGGLLLLGLGLALRRSARSSP